jgi:hypothetical protein
MKESCRSGFEISSEFSSCAGFAPIEVSCSFDSAIPEELEVFGIEREYLLTTVALEGFYWC